MENKEEQNWQPIKMLPMLSKMLSDQLKDLKSNYKDLLRAKPTPHVLDDYTVERVKKVYGEQLEYTDRYERQLDKWIKEEKLSISEADDIKKAQKTLSELRKILKEVLALVDELELGTIEKVMNKSDFELALEYLTKNMDDNDGK